MSGNTLLVGALYQGELEIKGQFMLGSNYTFLVDVQHNGQTFQAVYKPQRGERPLWDFPEESLAKREVAAYHVSQALGWNLVPLTVLRDGPFGPGSLQYYIPYDPEYHYFNFSAEDQQRLRPTVLFDLLINNADRKGSHILIGNDGHLWLIDHGVCFHEEDKLRTVIWDFAGEPIPEELLASLGSLSTTLAGTGSLRANLTPFLSTGEIDALQARADALLMNPVYPYPPEDRRAFPYPPV